MALSHQRTKTQRWESKLSRPEVIHVFRVMYWVMSKIVYMGPHDDSTHESKRQGRRQRGHAFHRTKRRFDLKGRAAPTRPVSS